MLIDQFGRQISYLRLSVTDRCNLRCTYCLPKRFKGFKEPQHWLTFDQIETVVALLVKMGIERVRLTGGEPLLRRGLEALVIRLSTLPGLKDLSLTTNAMQLPELAEPLYQAGVKRINVSMDSLRSECMRQITGADSLKRVMEGLMVAKAVGFSPIKLNMVVLSGVNDQEVESMADFCIENGFVLRLIEAMPIGSTGRSAPFASLYPLLEILKKRHQLKPLTEEIGGGPARYWGTIDKKLMVGLITPLSQHFCASCNRLRLSVDGILYTCLGQDYTVALRPILESGVSQETLQRVIRDAVYHKPQKHEFTEHPLKVMRFMSHLGG